MRNKLIGRIVTLSSLVFFLILSGCGSASNNDQGTAVTFLGYFQGSTAGTTTLPGGLSGAIIPLGTATTEPGSTPSTVGIASDGSFVGYVGFQNNLSGQGATIKRLQLDFIIPGATVNPPSTSVALGAVLGPLRTTTTGTTTTTDPLQQSSLPPAYYNIPNRSFSQTFLIPASVRAWMNLNRAQLPEPPFSMRVFGTAHYITTAGDANVTNEEVLEVSVVPETLVTPTEGTDDGSSSGASSDESAATLPATDENGDSTGTTDDVGTDLSVQDDASQTSQNSEDL